MRIENTLKNRRILVIEDEPFVRSVIVRVLRDLGEPRVEIAPDGAKALESLGPPGVPFDFALVDFNMPVMSGLDFLKTVRCGRSRARRDLPIAMLTGSADRELVGAAMALDVNAFVLKPASQKNLSERIFRMLSEEGFVQDVSVYEEVETRPSPLQQQRIETDARSPPAVLRPEPRRDLAAPPPRPAIKRPEAPAVVGPRMRKLIADLTIDSLLAEDILSPRGVRLLSAGVILNSRMLSRLRDLAEVNGIDYVWVQQPAQAV